MKKRMTAMLITVCITSMLIGCGGNTPSNKDTKTTNAQSSAIRQESSKTGGELNVNKNDKEIVKIEKSEEIKTASLESGKIQILEDVIQCGGFITIDDFIKKYSDKYDFGKIDVDSFAKRDISKYNTYTATRKDLYTKVEEGKINIYKCKSTDEIKTNGGKEIQIEITSSTPSEDYVRIGDCIVDFVILQGSDLMWFPQGFQLSLANKYETGYDYKNFKDEFIVPLGLTEIKQGNAADSLCFSWVDGMDVRGQVKGKMHNFGKIVRVNCYLNTGKSYRFGIMGGETNLYGKKPLFMYEFSEDDSNGKIYMHDFNIYSKYVNEPVDEKELQKQIDSL